MKMHVNRKQKKTNLGKFGIKSFHDSLNEVISRPSTPQNPSWHTQVSFANTMEVNEWLTKCLNSYVQNPDIKAVSFQS